MVFNVCVGRGMGGVVWGGGGVVCREGVGGVISLSS